MAQFDDRKERPSSATLEAKRTRALGLVSRDGMALAQMPMFRADFHVVRAAVVNDGKAIQHAADFLKDDEGNR